MLIVAMDANFRLQSRLHASSLKHPALSPGWAYFLDNSPYAVVRKISFHWDDSPFYEGELPSLFRLG
jgi:hypothetical protein